jgi:hypothetical protein
MILKQALAKPDDPLDILLDDVAFREKDALLLREECSRKYSLYASAVAQVMLSFRQKRDL